MKRPSRRTLFRAAALVLGCIVAAAVLEAASRILNPLGVRERASWHLLLWEGMRASDDPELVWEHVPGWSRRLPGYSVRINSLGLRGAEPRKAAARVLMLGDSMTFGMSGEEEDSAPRQVEALLADRDVEVVNGGVLGYTTLQEAALLERLLPELRPDAVVLWWFHNDTVRTGAANPAAQQDELRDLIGIRSQTPARAALHLAYEALPCATALARAMTVGRQDGDATAFAFDPAADPEGWKANREALAAIAAQCREAGAPLAVFTFRHYPELEAFCGEESLTYLWAMREAGESEALRYGVTRWDPHFTREGNALVAKTIAEHLRETLEPED